MGLASRTAVAFLAMGAAVAGASGPRWVTGPPFFTAPAGNPVAWSPRNLSYFTDPGDLSVYVNRQAADALVAAAAAAWNLPVANLSLARGGALAEHVSGANVYLGTGGMVYPADVASTNYAALPIAVVYDSDGSVTDTLLGAGASAPSGCRQNAVTESVDLFDPRGYILHAVVVVNGRCTGSAPQAQLQLQYQLERAFGRVLGLAWSQANDNVFTGTPVPTYNQALNWPIMHPMEIICGPYTYQCLPLAFQLRPDDIASMVLLYGIGPNDTAPAGKQISLSDATAQQGSLAFPTGEGMAGVNVLVQRMPGYGGMEEPWVTASAVTGAFFRRTGATPLTVAGTDAESSSGSFDSDLQGVYRIAYIALPSGTIVDSQIVTMEPVNPLYIGGYGVGPYGPGTVAPSGAPTVPIDRYIYVTGVAQQDATVTDAAMQCGTGLDGTEALPAQADSSGWWQGLLCGYGHASWIGLDVKPNRTLTLDVTALDELGDATLTKAMPVLGAWSAADATGTMPTMGTTAVAFNATSVGTSRLALATTQPGQSRQATRLRLTIADERGEGRPDFAYQARILYADSVLPTLIPLAGATVTIAGMGFRPGNSVTVNGVTAPVVSWTANAIVAKVPAMSAARAVADAPVDVTVTDLSTGASSTMTAALSFDSAATLPEVMKLVSTPSGNLFAGSTAATPFAVQVLLGDGITPVPGQTVTFSTSVSSVQFAACAAASCAVSTDANGMASTTVMPLAAGPVTLQATDNAMTQTSSFLALAAVASMKLITAPGGTLPIATQAQPAFTVQIFQADGSAASNVPVTFTASPADSVMFSACQAYRCTSISDSNGVAQTGVTPQTTGSIQMTAVSDGVSQSAAFTGVQPVDEIHVLSAPAGTSQAGTNLPFSITLTSSDGITPLFGRNVLFSGPAGVIFTGCNTSPCALITNWSGAGTGVVALVPGTFTVQVSEIASTGMQSNVQTATFTAVQPRPQIKLLSVPANGSQVGVPAVAMFSVQMLNANGTPMAGTLIAFNPEVSGTAWLSACPWGQCSIVTDGNGIASSAVIPMVAGPIVLEVTSAPLSLTATFNAVAIGDSLTAVQAAEYVAENTTVNWTLSALAMSAGTLATGQTVNWTGAPGFSVGLGPTVTDWNGMTQLQGTLGPLAAGLSASATACAWATVCTSFQGIGVAAADLRLLPVSGANQSVSGGATLQQVSMEVIDLSGHPVAGATVSIYQTTNASSYACPPAGRCPAAPVTSSAVSSAVSDVNGLVSVTPIVWSDGAETTHIAASAGTQGFAALDLAWTP